MFIIQVFGASLWASFDTAVQESSRWELGVSSGSSVGTAAQNLAECLQDGHLEYFREPLLALQLIL